MKRTSLLLILFLIILSACNHTLNKALKEMKEMPVSDYSYVVQPDFKISKELVEDSLKNLYNAEKVKIGAVGFHSVDLKTKTQKDEIFRLQTVLLNPKSISGFKNETKMNEIGSEVAKLVINNISNNDKYNKIEVSFIFKEENSLDVWRQNIFFKLPGFELTQMFDK